MALPQHVEEKIKELIANGSLNPAPIVAHLRLGLSLASAEEVAGIVITNIFTLPTENNKHYIEVYQGSDGPYAQTLWYKEGIGAYIRVFIIQGPYGERLVDIILVSG